MNRIGMLVLVLLCAVVAGCAAPVVAISTPSPTYVTTGEERRTISPTPEPTPVVLKEGDAGEDVAELRLRLYELGYIEAAEGDIYDAIVTAGMAAFQTQNGLPATGLSDEQTSELLLSTKALKDPFLDLAPTIRMEFAELVGDNGDYDYPAGYPAVGTYRVVVDLANQVTMVFEKDANGEYAVPVRYMLCSTGKDDCTPKGIFNMDKYHVRFSQFVRDKTYGQYWTQIRKAIYFHTILYTEKDTSTYVEKVYNKLGTMDSHGCIRLTVPDARWMWYNIAPDTECEIRDGSLEDKDTAAIRERLVLTDVPEERLSLLPGDIPDTDNWKSDDVPKDVPFVQGSQE